MEIQSWKTAINRKFPSAPLLRGIFFDLKKEDTVLDYGCGYGFDVKYLQLAGYTVEGYDKYHTPYKFTQLSKGLYNKVICSYVINVIPTIQERLDVLNKLNYFSSDNATIYITIRLRDRQMRRVIPAYDGVITSKKTFQKYYIEEEFLELLREVFKTENIRFKKIGSDNLMAIVEKQ